MFPSTGCFGSARAAWPKVEDNAICLCSCAIMNFFSVSLPSGGASSASLPASSSTQLPTRTPDLYSFLWLDTPMELLWNMLQALAVTTTSEQPHTVGPWAWCRPPAEQEVTTLRGHKTRTGRNYHGLKRAMHLTGYFI